MSLKELAKRIVWGKKYSSETYIQYLRSRGVEIGEDVTIFVPSKTTIDEIYPWMITIGNHVRITEGCKILAHDFAWSVPKIICGGVLGASGKVVIGNNVFIGMNSIICRNVAIGDNVVIGAGSVVTKDIPDNTVYAGNPAKKISNIDDWIKKRCALQKKEAIELVKEYYKRYSKMPDKYAVGEYFMLFTDAEHSSEFQSALNVCKNPQHTVEYMGKNQPEYHSYEEFLEDCMKQL